MEIEENKIIDSKNSYITKEDFIKILNDLKYTHVKEFDIHFITGFMYNTETKNINTLGFDFHLY